MSNATATNNRFIVTFTEHDGRTTERVSFGKTKADAVTNADHPYWIRGATWIKVTGGYLGIDHITGQPIRATVRKRK